MLRSISTILIICLLSSAGLASEKWQSFTTANSGLMDNAIRAIAFDADGSVWIGTDWGLANLADTVWTVYLTSNSGLPDNAIRSLAKDSLGRLWVGTFSGGLAIKDDSMWTVYDPINSDLPDFHVRAIGFEPGGKAWIGTTGGIVSIADTAFEVFNTLNTPELWSNNYTSVAIDSSDNSKWFGSINGGIAIWNDTIWQVIRTVNSGLPDNTVLDLDFDRNNNLWIATPASGISVFTGLNWIYYNVVNSNIPTNSVNSIGICTGGSVYSGSIDKGLLQFRFNSNWNSYTSDSSDILDDHLITVEVDEEGNVWAGTISSGLSVFSPELRPVVVDTQGISVDVLNYATAQDSSVHICIELEMDEDLAAISVLDSGSLGSLTVTSALCLDYMPDPEAFGEDTIRLAVCIADNCPGILLCDTVMAFINVESWDTATGITNMPDYPEPVVYPTMCTDHITIFNRPGTEAPRQLRICDMFGNNMMIVELLPDTKKLVLSIHDLPAGVYLVSMVYPHNSMTKKILKVNR